MNYRLRELDALALARPAILQREDGSSDNSYSILPFLARAGTIDAGAPPLRPERAVDGLTLAWTADGGEALPMALSMLGLRTRAFDPSDPPLCASELARIGGTFDALVDAPITEEALRTALERSDGRFIVEANADIGQGVPRHLLPPERTTFIEPGERRWEPICGLLDLARPAEAFPSGPMTGTHLFRDERCRSEHGSSVAATPDLLPMDDSPWVLPPGAAWRPRAVTGSAVPGQRSLMSFSSVDSSPDLVTLVETFPGNMAAFAREGVVDVAGGKRLLLSVAPPGQVRPLRSGAIASAGMFQYGRIEAEIRATAGSGLVTGFFLHRDSPRQEIDIELLGSDPRRMLVNVYFNPGDDGTASAFGYRGAPSVIDLGFDASEDFHHYAIDWSSDLIAWSVDGVTVHERGRWDPTPIPHLPMRVHANLWAPRSVELAGLLDRAALPASAEFRAIVLLHEKA